MHPGSAFVNVDSVTVAPAREVSPLRVHSSSLRCVKALSDAIAALSVGLQALFSAGGYTYLDVRPKLEFEDLGKVVGSVNVPIVNSVRKYDPEQKKKVTQSSPNDNFVADVRSRRSPPASIDLVVVCLLFTCTVRAVHAAFLRSRPRSGQHAPEARLHNSRGPPSKMTAFAQTGVRSRCRKIPYIKLHRRLCRRCRTPPITSPVLRRLGQEQAPSFGRRGPRRR